MRWRLPGPKHGRVARYEIPGYEGEFSYGLGRNVSRHLVYALTDPDDSVRYIGRSGTGLNRPREHVARSAREQTYKANWIRALLRRGLMFGVRVLEECESADAAACSEVAWIARGRALGWRLTNLTSGGEGAAVKRTAVDVGEVVGGYESGESILTLSRRLGVDRSVVRHRLKEAGIRLRSGSEQQVLRLRAMTPASRMALVRAAHVARRRAR